MSLPKKAISGSFSDVCSGGLQDRFALVNWQGYFDLSGQTTCTPTGGVAVGTFNPHVRSGSKAERLAASIFRPDYPQEMG